MKRPEILAPAGSRATLEAAVRAGADAVYFGLQAFNARARATNFDEVALGETLAYLHERNVKGYVTLNTLVFDDELPALERAIRHCAAAGVDAVIVQDVGVAKLVRAIAPSLPLHASTQMTCTDAGSVEFARALGAARVILARELSLEDIAQIRQSTDAELEVFVHGALCVSYSGQCLTSEAIGGRSANRGACAQACRLPYELIVDGALRDLGDKAYLLSPEDLEASALVPRLVALGVASLKIEGRLKEPDYVAATTRLYRAAVDAAVAEAPAPTEAERRLALQAYTRGSGPGFLGGVDHQRLVEGRSCDHRGLPVGELLGVESKRGKDWLRVRLSGTVERGDGILVEGGRAGEGEVGGRVWDVVSLSASEAHLWLGPEKDVREARVHHRVFKTSDPAASKAVLRDNASAPHRTAVDMRVSGCLGEHLVLEARSASGTSVRIEDEAKIEQARERPIDEATLRDKLGRLGDTAFVLRGLDNALPPNSLVPLSALNRARRAVVDALVAASHHTHATTEASCASLLAHGEATPADPPTSGLFVLCRNADQARAALDAGADGVYLDFLELTGTGASFRALRETSPEGRAPAKIGVAPPRIRKPGEEKIDKYLDSLGPDMTLVRGLGALAELGARRGEREAIGDFSLNVTNRIAAREVLSRGLCAFTPSFDLDAAQLLALVRTGLGPWAEVVVHHPMALFHMEHCVFAALLSEGSDHRTCGRPCERHHISLRDRANMDHPVVADVGCRNTVFHAKPQSALMLLPELQAAGVRRFRIELVRETPADVLRLVKTYRDAIEGRLPVAEAWSSLRTEAGYGIVRGSLRVLHA